MDLTPQDNIDRFSQLLNRRARHEIPMRGVTRMKKLAVAALFAGLLAACGGGGGNNPIKIIDSGSGGSDAGSDSGCNVLTQMGCAADQKCTWVIDQSGPPSVGHVGCAPDGTGTAGMACTYTMPPNGADNCK